MALTSKARDADQTRLSTVIDATIADIREAYLQDRRPWIVGFSGGKDSTALMQLIYLTLAGLPQTDRNKSIYVVASDTRVELPLISRRIRKELQHIQKAATQDDLPISTHLVFPLLSETFWVNLIGRGYPSPNSRFRWCTDRLKIRPVSAFIRTLVDRMGEVVIALGARKAESATRAQTMRRHTIPGSRFRPHADLPRAYVYTPIEEYSTQEVWQYLTSVNNPWGSDNRALVSLYRNANAECPLVIDSSTPSCGQSRFGCWACTVVETDYSLESLVTNGAKDFLPLLELRDYLQEIRSTPGARYDLRRNGQVPLRRDTDEVMTNTGPFTHETRAAILLRLLHAQKDSGIELIGGDELTLIQEIWDHEENESPEKPNMPNGIVRAIWSEVFGGCEMIPAPPSSAENGEDELLRQVCHEHGVPLEMMLKLRELEESYQHLKRRHGLPERMRETVRDACTESLESAE